MRKGYLLFVALCLMLPVSSQITISLGGSTETSRKELDQGVIRLFYEMKFVRNPEKPDNQIKDYMALEIGENGISRFYSDNTRRLDSLLVEMTKNISGGNYNFDFTSAMKENGISSGGDKKEVYKNYPQGKITVTDNLLRDHYLYEEDMNEFSWTILPETKEILSYQCQKAETDFRGRHYEAWFAVELPINDGPWKFNGLPGLILSLKDSENHYSYEAIGLENIDYPILFSERKYVITSRKELQKIQKRFIDNPTGFIRNSMPEADVKIKIKDESGADVDPSTVKHPYNPMELE